jgi:exopolysaccharide biosynthesis predicted pyruvyltransferase EpsI
VNFNQLNNNYHLSLCEFLKKQNSIFLLDELPGNLGDHLIWEGTEHFLNSNGIHFIKIPVLNIHEVLNKNASLVIPGSGALDTLFHEWLPRLVIEAADRFGKVIILPSSYDSRVPIVVDCLKKSNVFAFSREVESYKSCKNFSNISLSLDCALYFPFDRYLHDSISNELLVLRDDQGSMIDKKLYSMPKNNDISLTLENIDEWVNKIADYETIITDRLHVAVAAVMMNKKLYYIDPYNNKISIYFNFSFANCDLLNIEKIDQSWLIEHGYIYERNL